WRASSANLTSFAVAMFPYLLCSIVCVRVRSAGASALDDRHHVVFAHDEEVLAVHFHLGARILAEQHLVALLEVELANLAVLEDLALPDGDDLAANRLLRGRVGNHDAARRGALLLGAPDDDAIVQRPNLHAGSPLER